MAYFSDFSSFGHFGHFICKSSWNMFKIGSKTGQKVLKMGVLDHLLLPKKGQNRKKWQFFSTFFKKVENFHFEKWNISFICVQTVKFCPRRAKWPHFEHPKKWFPNYRFRDESLMFWSHFEKTRNFLKKTVLVEIGSSKPKKYVRLEYRRFLTHFWAIFQKNDKNERFCQKVILLIFGPLHF